MGSYPGHFDVFAPSCLFSFTTFYMFRAKLIWTPRIVQEKTFKILDACLYSGS
jgi:hypothetical protein